MKAVVQRVTRADCKVDGEITGQIGKGFLVLLGVGPEDTQKDADKLADKICGLRIFSDENDKINLSLNDVDGDLLVVSQFTLYADCHKGNRPSFVYAGKPQLANELYDYFMTACEKKIGRQIQHGIFGADMKISLLNDGPFTIILECVNGEILK